MCPNLTFVLLLQFRYKVKGDTNSSYILSLGSTSIDVVTEKNESFVDIFDELMAQRSSNWFIRIEQSAARILQLKYDLGTIRFF